MFTIAKLVHYLALTMFVGSIFSHIVLGITMGSDFQRVVTILEVKSTITATLICSGLIILVVSGFLLAFIRRRRGVQAWLKVKLFFVTLIIANAFFVLSPLGLERVSQAKIALSNGSFESSFLKLGLKEDIFGTANLVMVLIIITLSIRRRVFPKRRR